MISTVLNAITFITAMICFVNLVRDKRQYKSVAIVIAIALFALFIKHILLLLHNNSSQLIVAVYVMPTIFITILVIFSFANYKLFHSDERDYYWTEERKSLLVIRIFNIILSICSFFTSCKLLIGNYPICSSSYANLYTDFINALSKYRTNEKMYLFIYDNLVLIIPQCYTAIMILTSIITYVLSIQIEIQVVNQENFDDTTKHYVVTLLILIALLIVSGSLPRILTWFVEKY